MSGRRSFLIAVVLPPGGKELANCLSAVVIRDGGAAEELLPSRARDREALKKPRTVARVLHVVAPDVETALSYARATAGRWGRSQKAVVDLGIAPRALSLDGIPSGAPDGGPLMAVKLDPVFILEGEGEGVMDALRDYCRAKFGDGAARGGPRRAMKIAKGARPPLSRRAEETSASGIRRIFDLAAKLKDPVNLSIGQPHFDVSDAVKAAAIEAIRSGRNSYVPSAGIPELRERARRILSERTGAELEDAVVTVGVSGALTLSMLVLVDPGDEVLLLDPYFVSYKVLAEMVGGRPAPVDTYPDFRPSVEALESAATPRTRVLVLNSPSNPTGVVYTEEELRAVADFARERNLVVISDEIYDCFIYEGHACSIARFCPERTLVLNGLSKRSAMTGWRLGFAAGPAEYVQAMAKLQLYINACAPTPAQHAALAAIDEPFEPRRVEYARKRDFVCGELSGLYEFTTPRGAFYVFPKSPRGTGTEFVQECVAKSLLVVPGSAFSGRDSHFRISFAAADEVLRRGTEILRELAENGGAR